MLSRALISATVAALIGCFTSAESQAQVTNLEAGKSPSQIFAGTCTACHKSPRGLLRTVAPGSLTGFLRQHYTTSPEMAGLLSAYLVSNGAADTRYGGGQGKPEREGRPGGPPEQLDRQGRRLHTAAPSQEPGRPGSEPQPAAKPDADGLIPQGESERRGHHARRLARPVEQTSKPVEGEAAHVVGEHGGRKMNAKRRLGKRGRPAVEEPPKGDAAETEGAKPDAARTESGSEGVKEESAKTSGSIKEDKPAGEVAKDEAVKPETRQPSAEGKSESSRPESSRSESAKSEPVKSESVEAPTDNRSSQTSALRANPVPSVTPAPSNSPVNAVGTSNGTPAPASGASSTSAAQPVASHSAPPAARSEVVPPAPAVTASAPPPAPDAPAGPPVPPISK